MESGQKEQSNMLISKLHIFPKKQIKRTQAMITHKVTQQTSDLITPVKVNIKITNNNHITIIGMNEASLNNKENEEEGIVKNIISRYIHSGSSVHECFLDAI